MSYGKNSQIIVVELGYFHAENNTEFGYFQSVLKTHKMENSLNFTYLISLTCRL
jgi:hypothetical protein